MRGRLTSAVSEAVQDVALVAEALEAAGVVDAGVVAGPLEGALVNVWRTQRRVVVRMIKCYTLRSIGTGQVHLCTPRYNIHQCAPLV